MRCITKTREGRKQFFFEKKNQKTFILQSATSNHTHQETKVFCFFFSKKKAFLPYLWVITAKRCRARETRARIVPTGTPQIAAASS